MLIRVWSTNPVTSKRYKSARCLFRRLRSSSDGKVKAARAHFGCSWASLRELSQLSFFKLKVCTHPEPLDALKRACRSSTRSEAKYESIKDRCRPGGIKRVPCPGFVHHATISPSVSPTTVGHNSICVSATCSSAQLRTSALT